MTGINNKDVPGMTKENEKRNNSLAYRFGEVLGTVIIGSLIILVIAFTAKVLTLLF